ILREIAENNNLEGAVFIGDIPIPMIQDAQHLTSAFKIDQTRFTMQRISIATDCFYDDLDLVFNFIKQDEENPLLFYYSLSEQSTQYIEKDFYSGRIFPPLHDERKYAMIANYLTRIVEQKRHPEVLDTMITFTGHGYHSESLNSWENHSHMLREQFPNLYLPGGQINNFYHTMSRKMKDILIEELENPQLDMAIFHAHGGDDAQYLLGYPPAANARENVAEIKRFVRSKLRTAKRRGNYEESKKYYIENYDIPEHWIDDTFDEDVIREDSLYNAYLDMYSPDVEKMTPEADIIMFDECYNGQFYQKNYISGTYIFGKGTTVAGIANSVNVRQDIWANELLGLLRHGASLGEWHLSRNYIESQIIGDPTFHFAKPSKSPLKSSYKKLLRSDDASLRTYGVYQLAKMQGSFAENQLIQIYKTDPFANVRLEALKSLAQLRTPAFRELLKISITDPSELIRRITANWMGKIGSIEYFPYLIDRMYHDISKRVSYSAKTELDLLFSDPDLDLIYDAFTITLDDTVKIKQLDYRQKRAKKWLYDEIIPTLLDTSLTVKKRMSKARSFRNYNFAAGIPTLLNVALDESDDPVVRTTCVEALGWFTMNPSYKMIIEQLKPLTESPVAEVKAEAIKSIKRLEHGPNLVITP
ncbi:MAG: HEAT repeat domain-containing protein, partial [Candidatus Marinimicrobia bacterium]|nr:HEAT repeat domain-containing protein [Candidatus Neomarinimicrobiota bacterium]